MADIKNMTPAGVDDDGKKVFYGTVPGKELTATLGFYYEDGSSVPVDKLINNPQASQFAAAGWDVGAGAGTSPAGQKYAGVLSGKTGPAVLAEPAPTYGDATYDPVNKIVIVRDENGTSIYNEEGNLISGRGSARQIGIAAGSGGLKKQIDINAVGSYGTPEYSVMAGQGPKQNLAYAGSKAQADAFKAAGVSTPGTVPVTTSPSGMPTQPVASTSASVTNPYAPGTQAYQSFEDKRSAWALLQEQFNQYGLGSLVPSLQSLIQENVSPSEFTLRLRESDAYKKRFAANAQRIAKGLRTLSEAEYINLEDGYQNVMRNYGLPESYYAKGDMGIQQGFEKFIAGDVSAAELEDRIQTAQNRVINAAPEVSRALKEFYPDITNGDILAYALDPQQALTNIKRKVQAAEIGGAAMQSGLGTSAARAEELQKYGVNQQQAQQGYQTIGGGLQRGSELASLYAQSPYTQTTAEQEVFGLPSATDARKKRQQLIGLERATFGGQTGAGGALQRERSGQY